MKIEDNNNNFTVEFGVVLEEKASDLTKGSNGRNMEHHYVPFLKP